MSNTPNDNSASGDGHDGYYYCPPVVHQRTDISNNTASRKQPEGTVGERSAPWFSSLMTTLKAKGHDMQCTIDEKMKQLKVPEGSLGHIWNVGKHKLLTQAGYLEESRDVEYEVKLKAAKKSKSLLMQIENELQQVQSTTSQMMMHFDTLLDLFYKFRHVYDSSQMDPLDSKCSQGISGNLNDSTEDNEIREATEKEHDSNLFLLRNKQHDINDTPEDIKLANIRKSLHDVTNTLQEALKGTCISIASTALSQLDHTQSTTIGKVLKAKCDLDLLRHRIMKGSSSGGGDLSANKEMNVVPNSLCIPLEEASDICQGVDDSYVTTNDRVANSPSCGERTLHPSVASSAPVSSTHNELIKANLVYNSEVSEAKEQLTFILEQTSMSTMSCYNVFFSQMAVFFQSAQEKNTSLAKVIVQLKNSQDVALKLTKERNERIMNSVRVNKGDDLRVKSTIVTTTTDDNNTVQSSSPSSDIINFTPPQDSTLSHDSAGSSAAIIIEGISSCETDNVINNNNNDNNNTSRTSPVLSHATTMGVELFSNTVSTTPTMYDDNVDTRTLLDDMFS